MDIFRRIVVIAGTYLEFKSWCWESHISPNHAWYIWDAAALDGMTLQPWQVVRYGTYKEREDIVAVEFALKSRYRGE